MARMAMPRRGKQMACVRLRSGELRRDRWRVGQRLWSRFYGPQLFFGAEVFEQVESFFSGCDDVLVSVVVEVFDPEVDACSAGGFWVAIIECYAVEFSTVDFEIVQSDGVC